MGALVADVHNLLVYGGIFGYPGTESKPKGMDNIHTYIHAQYINTFIHTFIHTYTYIHTYIPKLKVLNTYHTVGT